MSSEELLNNIISTYNELENELKFTGFSEPSVSFYDDYPEPGNSKINLTKAIEWWTTKQGENGDYKKYLKPEFENLIKVIERHKLDLSNLSPSKSQLSENLSNDIIDQINKLNDLYKNGILTKDEFEKAKKKILN